MKSRRSKASCVFRNRGARCDIETSSEYLLDVMWRTSSEDSTDRPPGFYRGLDTAFHLASGDDRGSVSMGARVAPLHPARSVPEGGSRLFEVTRILALDFEGMYNAFPAFPVVRPL